MKITAKDKADAERREASRQEAERRLEEAHRIAQTVPQQFFYSGLGPPKFDKTR
jgi:hypothetical protein